MWAQTVAEGVVWFPQEERCQAVCLFFDLYLEWLHTPTHDRINRVFIKTENKTDTTKHAGADHMASR